MAVIFPVPENDSARSVAAATLPEAATVSEMSVRDADAVLI